jgi:hypothetical protein
MSNKKLFWIAFFILSCCEFGQVAYSKSMSSSVIASKSSGSVIQCLDENAANSYHASNFKLSSYPLPR